tara:strand:- start:57 stop:1466 length:1410 start_codon:yes stop_codon:yes gene_type:complete
MKSSLFLIKIRDILILKKYINLNPAYQRDYVANQNKSWQEKFICSIFQRTTVIPNLYARTDNEALASGELVEQFSYLENQHFSSITEMVDGQQRFRTLLDWFDDKFKLVSCSVNELSIVKDTYGKLRPKFLTETLDGMNWSTIQMQYPELAEKFLDTTLQLSVTHSDIESEIMDMFCRLNDLNTMTDAEKRNAIDTYVAAFVRGTSRIGKWRHFDYPLHDLFERDKKTLQSKYFSMKFNKMKQDELLAKITAIVEGTAKDKGIGNNALNYLYIKPDYRTSFEPAAKVIKVLDKLKSLVENKEYKKMMNLGVIINLTLLVNYLMDTKTLRVSNWNEVMSWFMKTHKQLQELSKAEKDAGLVETNYSLKTRLASDGDGLAIRLQYLLSEIGSCNGVVVVDKTRVISDSEFFKLWLKSTDEDGKNVCCDCGCRLPFNLAVKAHRKAYANGGESTTTNTKVCCVECNRVEMAA